MKANLKQIILGLGVGTLAYYIAKKLTSKKGEVMSKVEGGFGNGINFADANGVEFIDGDYYNADGDFYSTEGDFYDADGDFYGFDGEFFGADGEEDEYFGADGEGEETSEARGRRKKRRKAKKHAKGKLKKRGRKPTLKQRLIICQRRVQALTKARQKLIAQNRALSRKQLQRVDRKLSKSNTEVKQLSQQVRSQPKTQSAVSTPRTTQSAVSTPRTTQGMVSKPMTAQQVKSQPTQERSSTISPRGKYTIVTFGFDGE